jgi:hypothetical protein
VYVFQVVSFLKQPTDVWSEIQIMKLLYAVSFYRSQVTSTLLFPATSLSNMSDCVLPLIWERKFHNNVKVIVMCFNILYKSANKLNFLGSTCRFFLAMINKVMEASTAAIFRIELWELQSLNLYRCANHVASFTLYSTKTFVNKSKRTVQNWNHSEAISLFSRFDSKLYRLQQLWLFLVTWHTHTQMSVRTRQAKSSSASVCLTYQVLTAQRLVSIASGLAFRTLRSTHTVHLSVLFGSQNKQRLFPYTALTDCFL